MTDSPLSTTFDHAPYRLSGVVYGTLFNHAPALAALGDQVSSPPYKAPPVAPVMYVKPRNTLITNGAAVRIPRSVAELEAGAALGVVIARAATRLTLETALEFVAGYTVVNDVSVPHDKFYRPSVGLKARDTFCPISTKVVARDAVLDPDTLRVRVLVDGKLMQETSTGERLRNVAQLLVDITEFMTLHPGDVLMTGVAHGAPRVKAGQEVAVEIESVGCLRNRFVTESIEPEVHE